MAIDGWYYLHTNGDLIYKREYDGVAADLRDSDFVKAFWPLDLELRQDAWTILIEGLAAGANTLRVFELAAKWGCDDKDGQIYAEYNGINLTMDGDEWMATRSDFYNLQESPVGFGRTVLGAFAGLAKDLGYRPSKMWVVKFIDML